MAVGGTGRAGEHTRRQVVAGAVLLGSTGLLGACRDKDSAGGAVVIAAAPEPNPIPPPVAMPTSTPVAAPTPSVASITPLAASRARLAAAAAANPSPLLYGWNDLQLKLANERSPIANRWLVPATSPAFRYVGRMEAAGDAAPLASLVRNTAVNFGFGRYSDAYYFEFQTDAPVLELLYLGGSSSGAHRIQVDGRYISLSTIRSPEDGNLWVTRATLHGRSSRRIRISTTDMKFGGVFVDAADSVGSPVADDPVRAVILGDSYTEGTSGVAGVDELDTYGDQLARLLGWSDAYRSGVGGTGYLAAPAGRLAFADRLADDVVAFRPEVLVIAGGINDPLVGLERAASDLFDTVQARLPDTTVLVLGPWDPTGGLGDKAAAIGRAVGTRANFAFIDNVGERWFTGSGNAGHPNGSGNTDQFIGADGIHPTQAGHDYLAAKLADAARQIFRRF